MYDARVRGDDMEHKDYCAERTAKAEREREAWAKAHPGYCEKCEGRGGHSYNFDPSPAGVSLAPGWLHDWDPCPECLEQDKCPWCGAELITAGGPREAYAACVSCEWNEADHEDRGMPPLPECDCWIDGYMREQEEAERALEEILGR